MAILLDLYNFFENYNQIRINYKDGSYYIGEGLDRKPHGYGIIFYKWKYRI